MKYTWASGNYSSVIERVNHEDECGDRQKGADVMATVNKWQLLPAGCLAIMLLAGRGTPQALAELVRQYSENGYGGRLERIGEWAYVHE